MKSHLLVQANCFVTLTDGIRLATDIYRPAERKPVAVLLVRTPYGKAAHLAEGTGWARHGFAFVAQDVRGRYDSEGEWRPYVHEREDSAQVIGWLAQQPWCKHIIVTGGSYSAYTAWMAIVSRHSAVQAAIIQVPAMGTHAVNFANNGILQLYNHAWWWINHAEGRTTRTALCERMVQCEPDILSHLPVVELPDRFWVHLAEWSQQVTILPDELPAYALTDEEMEQVNIPVLHIGGWHDPFIAQTLRQWQITGSALPSRTQQLLIGPWSHELEFQQPASYGEREYGPASQLPLGRLLLQWLRHLFVEDEARSYHNPFAEHAVLFFMTGQDRWVKATSWPPPTVQGRYWYAHTDGSLQQVVPVDGGVQRFVYDPDDPYPSRAVPVDRRDLLERSDAVRFVTPPLDGPLTYVGEPVVTLYAMTDALDTDWVASVHEITADERQLYLGHAIINAQRALASPDQEFVTGAIHQYILTLRALAIQLPAGHRLCLEITSSDFPQHARNLNTGQDRYTTDTLQRASQTIFCGPQTPTALMLPCISQGVSHDNA